MKNKVLINSIVMMLFSIGQINFVYSQTKLSDTIYIKKPLIGKSWRCFQNGKSISYRKVFKLCKDYQDIKPLIREYRQIILLSIPTSMVAGVSIGLGIVGIGLKESSSVTFFREVCFTSGAFLLFNSIYLDRIALKDIHTIVEMYNKHLKE